MTIENLLSTCHESGVRLQWNGNKITAYGDERIITQLLPLLRNHKEELKAFFAAEATEYYHERAGIAEFDGGLSRSDAEAQALAGNQKKTFNSFSEYLIFFYQMNGYIVHFHTFLKIVNKDEQRT